MPQKIKNTFSILPYTDDGLRLLCELTHRTYQGDMIDLLTAEELSRRGITPEMLEQFRASGRVSTAAALTVTE